MKPTPMRQSSPQKSPLSLFFKLGDKVTQGDPRRKMDFDYYMMWIIFLAFFGVFTGNLWSFFTNDYPFQNLGWAFFGLAIMWFQYFNLKAMWTMRNYQRGITVEKEEKIEDLNEMIKGFKK